MTLEAVQDEPLSIPGLWDAQPWSIDALCAQTDPEAFFPEKGGSVREAKAVCAACPVLAECLDWALDRDERYGVWGGLSAPERRQILKGTRPRPVLTVVATPPPAPTPPPEAPAMTQPAQPSYVDQILTVMVATEGHPNAAVRAARKVVANALVALNKALTTSETPPPAEEPPPEPAVSSNKAKGAASHALRERIEQLGTSAADIRQYARSQGHHMGDRGRLPDWAVDLYEQAHTTTTTGDTPA